MALKGRYWVADQGLGGKAIRVRLPSGRVIDWPKVVPPDRTEMAALVALDKMGSGKKGLVSGDALQRNRDAIRASYGPLNPEIGPNANARIKLS